MDNNPYPDLPDSARTGINAPLVQQYGDIGLEPAKGEYNVPQPAVAIGQVEMNDTFIPIQPVLGAPVNGPAAYIAQGAYQQIIVEQRVYPPGVNVAGFIAQPAPRVMIQGVPIVPIVVRCPVCRIQTSSITRRVASGAAWIWCIILFCLFWPLCWIPLVMDSCQSTQVICTNCGTIKATID